MADFSKNKEKGVITAEAHTESSLICPIQEEEVPKLLSLPQEILFDILKRLPAESLTRSAFVCKVWRSLILSSRQFNELHAKYSNRCPWKHPFFISWNPLSMKSTFDHNFDWEEFVPYGRDPNVLQPHILGSCEGLFFMQISTPSEEKEDEFRKLLLWNPYTNLVKPLSGLNHGHPLISGLACDYKTRDTKAILVTKLLGNCNFLVSIFSNQGNSWKQLTSNGVLNKYKFDSSFASTTFDGIPHWVGQYQSKMGFALVCFDPYSDTVSEMSLPLPDKLQVKCGVQIGILGGRLCTAITVAGKNAVEVWSMNEYGVKESWTRIHSIVLLKPIHSTSLKPLGYSSHGKLLMVSVEYPDEYPFRAYWVCDIHDKEGKGIATQLMAASSAGTSVVAEVYTESLIWLDDCK